MASSDPTSYAYYSEMLEVGLGDTPARAFWRKLMKVNGSSFPGRGTLVEESFLEGKAEGQAAGLAQAVLQMLAHRGITVSDETRERITGCHDLDTLNRWVDEAFTVAGAEELLDGIGAG